MLCACDIMLWRHYGVAYMAQPYLLSYPGYFREPHWISMGLTEISRVTRQVWISAGVCMQTEGVYHIDIHTVLFRIPTDKPRKISMIFQWYFKAKIPNFHENSERYKMEKHRTMCYTWSLHASYDHWRNCPACRTSLIATRFWVVMICPIIKCLTVLEFSFILFDLCLFITIFNFILNYIPIVTFWIFTYHKIWILLIIFCFIWSYWIIYFLTCLEVFWSVVS